MVNFAPEPVAGKYPPYSDLHRFPKPVRSRRCQLSIVNYQFPSLHSKVHPSHQASYHGVSGFVQKL